MTAATPLQNPLDALFADRTSPALVAYLTALDPDFETSLALLHALADGGADVIELGVPFSDPGADGPVLQRAAERALAGGATLDGVLALASTFDRPVPLVLFGYLNPYLAYGYERLAERCAEVGIAGVLCVDCPPGEEPALWRALGARGIHPIRLLAPTTPDDRIQAIARTGGGFLYYVSQTGVTGAALTDRSATADRVRRVKALTDLPVAVGFGISTPAQARALGEVADGIVVGSALVRLVEAHGREAIAPVRALTGALKGALLHG